MKHFIYLIKNKTKGAILIEFAIGLPILFILILYIHDLTHYKKIKDKTEFIAYEMANLFQNVSQNRINKAITFNDCRYVTAAAYLTFYRGTAMYFPHKESGGHFPHPIIYYVKGLDNGNASCIWRTQMHPSTNTTPSTMLGGPDYVDYLISAVRYKTNVPPAQIYPGLKIKPGEIKIIIDSFIFYHTTHSAYGAKGLSPREVFGFKIITPKFRNRTTGGISGGCNQNSGFFNSVVIFTPKAGLFSETPPK